MSTVIEEHAFVDLHEKFDKLKHSIKKQQERKECDNRKEQFENLDEHFESLTSDICAIMSRVSPDHDQYIRVLLMKVSLMYERAKLLVSHCKESDSERLLDHAIDELKDTFMHENVAFLYLRLINHYSYLLSKRNEYSKAQLLLQKSESIYKTVKGDKLVKTYNTEDIFQPKQFLDLKDGDTIKLEKLMTNNLQMLCWIYNQQNCPDKFARYHHIVLRRQLEMRDGNVLDWALKASRLALFFLGKNNFKQARLHLAASTVVLIEYERDLKSSEDTDKFLVRYNELQYYYADIANSWVKYGLQLFDYSKTYLTTTLHEDYQQVLDQFGMPLYRKNGQTSLVKTRSKITCTSKINVPNEQEAMKLPEKAHSDPSVIYENKKSNAVEKEKLVAQGDVGSTDTQKFTTKVIYEKSGEKGDIEESEPENITSKEHNDASGKHDFSCQYSETKISDSSDMGHMSFPSLDLKYFEESVVIDTIETTDQARMLFTFTHSWLKRSKLYFTYREFPLDYINVTMDLSELYRYLAFFEHDLETQYDIHRRRNDVLETLCTIMKEIRPQGYFEIKIELLREISEVLIEMLRLNLRRLYGSENEPDNETVCAHRENEKHKVNALTRIHARLEQFNDDGEQDESAESELYRSGAVNNRNEIDKGEVKYTSEVETNVECGNKD